MLNDEQLKLTVITDVHYYSPQVGSDGEAYEKALMSSQKLLLGSRELITAAFNKIAADSSSNTVLIPGDVTNDGETVSHEEFRELLRTLKNSGKNVYLITATHDYHKSKTCKRYSGKEITKAPALSREELYEFYREFGPDDAICSNSEFMSYIIQLPGNCRLFALNDDHGFSEEMMEWIKEQAEDAQKNGQLVIAMTHHPLIPPSPMYELIGKGDMHKGYTHRRDELADLGIQFMLTGHTHTHNIGRTYSPRGNAFYAISTASLIGYPAPIRHLTIDPAHSFVSVDTEKIESAPGLDTKGLALEPFLKKQLIGVIAEMIRAAGSDINRFAYMAQSISIKPRLVYSYGWLVKPLFGWLNRVKFKTFAKWTKKETGLKPADWARIKNDKVVDFIIDLVSNLFSGENTMTLSDPKCRIYVGFLKIIDSVLRVLNVNLGKITKVAPDAAALLAPLACKGEFDAYSAVLPVNEFVPTGSKAEKAAPPQCDTSSVKTSKKGPAIIIIGVVLAILLLPLILLFFLLGFSYNRIKYAKKIKGVVNNDR